MPSVQPRRVPVGGQASRLAARFRIPAGGQIVKTGDQRECLGAEKLKLLFDPKSQLAAL